MYPEVGQKAARERRDDARKLLAAGVDPSMECKVRRATTVERSANSFEAVAREWYAKQSPGWTTGHGDKVIRRLERDAFPWVGCAAAGVTSRIALTG
ncbi:phage integrase central domain-containing protein [Cupriavidus laharis]|uniref:phage integrase central domain-containing protein n=1 Tax=Cupriavidus laharis TaxID=151654 RepID=UPI002961EB4C|nr:hypothetical protein [Cupriavidus laharis]